MLRQQLLTKVNFPHAAGSGEMQPKSGGESSNESSSDDNLPQATPKQSKWTKEQLLTAISLSLINFTTQVSFAVIAPFFSVEAGKKGATSTEIGLIFGAFQLVIFITSPFYGRFVSSIYYQKLGRQIDQLGPLWKAQFFYSEPNVFCSRKHWFH